MLWAFGIFALVCFLLLFSSQTENSLAFWTDRKKIRQATCPSNSRCSFYTRLYVHRRCIHLLYQEQHSLKRMFHHLLLWTFCWLSIIPQTSALHVFAHHLCIAVLNLMDTIRFHYYITQILQWWGPYKYIDRSIVFIGSRNQLGSV